VKKNRSKSLCTNPFLEYSTLFFFEVSYPWNINKLYEILEIVQRSNVSKSGEDQTGRVLLVERLLGIPQRFKDVMAQKISTLIQGASSSLEVVIQFMPFSESMDPIPNQPQAITCSKSIMPIMINTKLNWMDATCQMSKCQFHSLDPNLIHP